MRARYHLVLSSFLYQKDFCNQIYSIMIFQEDWRQTQNAREKKKKWRKIFFTQTALEALLYFTIKFLHCWEFIFIFLRWIIYLVKSVKTKPEIKSGPEIFFKPVAHLLLIVFCLLLHKLTSFFYFVIFDYDKIMSWKVLFCFQYLFPLIQKGDAWEVLASQSVIILRVIDNLSWTNWQCNIVIFLNWHSLPSEKSGRIWGETLFWELTIFKRNFLPVASTLKN